MSNTSSKRVAKLRITLNKRNVDALKPEDKPWIAWDDRLTGFGVRVHPTGAKSFIVNYRAGDGGRKAPNKRVVIGRYGRITPDQGSAARSGDPRPCRGWRRSRRRARGGAVHAHPPGRR